jgi:plasmid stability protein
MGSILVRGLDQRTIERLKERARLNRRSLQQEVKALLERAAETLTMREALRVSERWRRRLRGLSLPL